MNAFVCLSLLCPEKKTKLNHGGECEKLSFYFVFSKPDYLSEIHFTISVTFFYSACVRLG